MSFAWMCWSRYCYKYSPVGIQKVYAQRAVKKTIQHELAAPELECRLPKTGKASLRQRASTLSHAAYLANIYRLLVISIDISYKSSKNSASLHFY